MPKLILSLLLLIAISSNAQQLTTTPNGGNKKSWVGERVGLTDVTINYNSPRVNGREGKIWGQLVAYGFTDQGAGTSKASPWRAGANENTTIEFSNPVKIEGKDLPAGKYGFFIEVQPDYCNLIFNKRTTSWGSYFYDPKEDVLKVQVKQILLDKSQEWLKYAFSDPTANSALVSLVWEKWKIPFKIETNLVQDQINKFREELTSAYGFDYRNWNFAAQYLLNNNVNLEEALQWSENSLSPNFGGQVNFANLYTKAGILDKLGRISLADSIYKQALPMANVQQISQYGRDLIKKKKFKEALQVFESNYSKNPNQFVTLFGMARAYSALGEYDKALGFAKKSLPLAPNPPNKKFVEDSIEKLAKKQDIN